MTLVDNAKPSEHAPRVNAYDAKTHVSKLLEPANAGQEFVVAKRGLSYAPLVLRAPITRQRKAGRLAGRVGAAFFDPLVENELATWDRASSC